MKRLCLLVSAALVAASSVFAQGTVYLSGRADGVGCGVTDRFGMVPIYVIGSFNPWGGNPRGTRFSAPLPSCATGLTYMYDEVYWPHVGDSQNGIDVQFGICLSERTVVMTIWMMGSGTTPGCCYMISLGHPDSELGKIEVDRCDGTVMPVGGGVAKISTGDPYCECTGTEITPEVSHPRPANDSTGVDTTVVLTWDTYDPQVGVSKYQMAFGETSPPPVVANQFTGASWDPGTLAPGKKYYWRVAVWWYFDGALAPGPIWSFTTADVSTATKVSTWGAVKALYSSHAP